MSKLILYRQMRTDGRIRTGVDVDDFSVAELFDDGGDEEFDPILLWFIDLRCEGSAIPCEPGSVLNWLDDHAATIRDGLTRCSESLEVGLDPDIYPLIWSDFADHPSGVKMTVACSAKRMSDARAMATLVGQISLEWPELIVELRKAALIGNRA